MNKYESVLILTEKVENSEREKALDRIRDFIKENGNITREENIGIRKFAYEIKKQTQGYYYQINFEIEANLIAELERRYRITDEILKFIIVKQEG